MGEVNVSPEALKVMESLPDDAYVEVFCTMVQVAENSESAARVESIVWDAEDRHVSMDVRIMPVLTNVNMEIRVA